MFLSEALGWDGLDGWMGRLMFHKDMKYLRRRDSRNRDIDIKEDFTVPC